jgi:hypothetical protein
MNFDMKILCCMVALCVVTVHAQLAVTMSPLKIVGQKAVIELKMKNGFSENVESARAMCFLLDEHGKMVGQASRWVIGGTKDRPALEPKKDTTFNFVIATSDTTATNLMVKVSFTRMILAGGQVAYPTMDVSIEQSKEK